jgi:hypothetical protein
MFNFKRKGLVDAVQAHTSSMVEDYSYYELEPFVMSAAMFCNINVGYWRNSVKESLLNMSRNEKMTLIKSFLGTLDEISLTADRRQDVFTIEYRHTDYDLEPFVKTEGQENDIDHHKKTCAYKTYPLKSESSLAKKHTGRRGLRR